MFALPHHVESFDSATANAKTTVQLQTTTKGLATAVLRDSWTMTEDRMATDIGFAPWNPDSRGSIVLSEVALQAINQAGASELSQDMEAQSNLDSMYFSGKVRHYQFKFPGIELAHEKTGVEQIRNDRVYYQRLGKESVLGASWPGEIEGRLRAVRGKSAEISLGV